MSYFVVDPKPEQPGMVDVNIGFGPRPYFKNGVLKCLESNGFSGLAARLDSDGTLDVQLTSHDFKRLKSALPDAAS